MDEWERRWERRRRFFPYKVAIAIITAGVVLVGASWWAQSYSQHHSDGLTALIAICVTTASWLGLIAWVVHQ